MIRARVPYATTPRPLHHYPEQFVAAYGEGHCYSQGWIVDGPIRGPGRVQRDIAAFETNHAGGTFELNRVNTSLNHHTKLLTRKDKLS